MPTSGERKALLFFGVVIVLGATARGVAVLHSQAPIDAAARNALDAQIQAVDSVRHRGKTSGSKRGRKKKEGATHLVAPTPFDESRPSSEYTPAIVDLDVASAAEIETI